MSYTPAVQTIKNTHLSKDFSHDIDQSQPELILHNNYGDLQISLHT